jgi:hypothetical protein
MAYKEMSIFLGCIFMPIIYLSIIGMAVNWKKNDYWILVEIDEYNKKKKI